MKRFISFVKKEFLHVLRDPKTLFILFGMPIAQILIFGFALTNEVKNAKVIVIDQAQDAVSRQISAKIDASNYFQIVQYSTDPHDMERAFTKGEISLAIVYPSRLQYELAHDNQSRIQIIADATNPNNADILTNYASAIIRDFQPESKVNRQIPYQVHVKTRMLYNPQLEGKYNFVPGVMAMVLLLLCVMMTAISIVREKERGNMEVLLVSPFHPVLVILSKAFPYLILSVINLILILLMSVYALHLPVQGSLVLLFLESTLFIITCLTLGILISIKSNSQEAAMLISLMGMMLPTILFSGFMFPIENMPYILQVISNVVPSKWFYLIVKDIMIKGMGISSIWRETLILLGMTLILLLVSIKSFDIRLRKN